MAEDNDISEKPENRDEDGEGGPRPPISLTDIVLSVIGLFIAGPFCGAGAEALIHKEYSTAVVGFIIGLPLGIGAVAFPFLNRRRGLLRGFVNWHGRWALPVASLIAFAYVVGPDVYRRATYVAAVPPSTSPSLVATAQCPEIAQLTDTLRSQDTCKQDLETNKSQLADAQQALEIARHPSVTPGKTPTWLTLQFNDSGEPKETDSTNVHWASWNPRNRNPHQPHQIIHHPFLRIVFCRRLCRLPHPPPQL
jgi:hypothetical protein